MKLFGVEDMDNKIVYEFKITLKEVCFAEACGIVRRWRQTASVCFITHKFSGRHALAAFDFLPPEARIIAVNSRSPTATYVELAPQV